MGNSRPMSAEDIAAFVKKNGRAPGPAEDKKTGEGKPRPSLLPWDAVQATVRVMEGGAAKYGPRSWQYGESVKYVDAAARHLIAMLSGEMVDPESGELHATHLACNALIVGHLQNRDR